MGSADAKVKVVVFSNFQNPTDKQAFQTIIAPMVKEYGDRIQVAFKNYLPPASVQATSAALASACANEQGKFLAYGDKLFATQAVWGKAKDATPLLKSYAASAGLNTVDFGKCLDDKKYQDSITEAFAEGQSFGITATPAIFVGSDLQIPTAKYDDIRSVIDGQLAE
jgi:protein-disulfide isomerase